MRSFPARSFRAPVVAATLAAVIGSAVSVAAAQGPPAQLHRDIGMALGQQGRYVEAVDNFRKAIRLDPELADAYTGLGMALMSLRRYEEALEAFRAVEREEPSSARARYDVGLALSGLERHDDAVASFREALRLDSTYVEARVALLATLGRLGRHDEALRVLEKLTGRRDEGAAAGRQGLSAALSGRHVDAIAHWTRALRADPAYFEQRPAEKKLYLQSLDVVDAQKRSSPRD
jgi:tetratricopeptide (TPR) repeat protein